MALMLLSVRVGRTMNGNLCDVFLLFTDCDNKTRSNLFDKVFRDSTEYFSNAGKS